MIKRPKIAIIGAGGNVGAAVAQWAVQKELGDLVLIDIKAGPAEGRALDLTQCGPWEGFNNTSFVATDKRRSDGRCRRRRDDRRRAAQAGSVARRADQHQRRHRERHLRRT